MDYDANGDRIVVADRLTHAIYGFDAVTGAAEVISSDSSEGAEPASSVLADLVVDSANGRALVVDSGRDTLFAVDLETGKRTVLSADGDSAASTDFAGARGIAFDAEGNRAFVTAGVFVSPSFSVARVIEVDLTDGTRRVISDHGSTLGPPVNSPFEIVYDNTTTPGTPRLLLYENWFSGAGIMEIDLGTLQRKWLEPFRPGSVAALIGTPTAFRLAPGSHRLLLINLENQLLAIDLVTRDVELLGGVGTGSGDPIASFPGIALKDGSARTVFTAQQHGEILATDLTSLNRSTLVQSRVGAGTRLDGPGGLAIEQRTGSPTSLLVAGRSLQRIDLSSGDRSTIAADIFAWDVELDRRTATPTALVLTQLALTSVDLATGTATEITPDSFFTTWIEGAPAVALDAATNRALWISQEPGNIPTDRLNAIDLASGTITTLADQTHGSGPGLIAALDVVLEPTGNPTRAIVSDSALGALISVDLTSGVRTSLTASEPNFKPAALFADSARGRVIGFDQANGGSLFSVDLQSGARQILSGADANGTVRGSGPLLGDIQALGVDVDDGVAFVTDFRSNAVIAVDIVTGERVLISH